MQEKGSELENQDPGFQISGEITEEDFENVFVEAHIPVFIFVRLIEKKSTENQNIGLPILNSFQEGITIIYNGQNQKKFVTIIRELSE